jgi:hypothetical protein
MDLLEILKTSGPLPVELILWKGGDDPTETLARLLQLQDQKLLSVRGMPSERLQDLLIRLRGTSQEGLDAALSAIHASLGETDATIELTADGLRVARAA